MGKRRGIGREFVKQFKSGVLYPILQRVQHDDTLSLEIRNGYVDIYYRGGRLLGIHATTKAGKFLTKFDKQYYKLNQAYYPVLPEGPSRIASQDDARAWVNVFADYKQVMDVWFSDHPRIEREYQQAVVRDNNRHRSGDLSDYVVVDVEYAQSADAVPGQKTNYKFDMVGFRWPAAGKTRRSGLATPVIMEMKAGDGALASAPKSKNPEDLSSGLVKHLLDIERFLTPESGEAPSKPYSLLREELETMFREKQDMNLPLPKGMRDLTITGLSDRPEVLFVLANHYPPSTILARELKKLPPREHADYRVARVSYAGYALFKENIVPLDDFIAHLP